jgi:hypothetical protein
MTLFLGWDRTLEYHEQNNFPQKIISFAKMKLLSIVNAVIKWSEI